MKLLLALASAVVMIGIAAPAYADHDSDRHGRKSPRVVLISLDGAKPDFIQKFIDEGVLPHNGRPGFIGRMGRGLHRLISWLNPFR